ncbi:MAG TPA: acyltransferase [Terriglobales bacterium]|nr:acyltransferase [Terriglobales bacterium]
MVAAAVVSPVQFAGRAISARILSETRRPARFYRPELDVLRFFAFLSVFLHHGLPNFEASHFTGKPLIVVQLESVFKTAASFGVCLFFVLSAYLITELLDRERSLAGTVNIGSFYVRRILRIWPLYFIFLFFAFGLGEILPACHIEPARLWSFVFLAGNWYVAAAGCAAFPIAPLWSISLEEQFYLAWPWIAKLGGPTLIAGLSLALLPASWVMLVVLSRRGTAPDSAIWVNSFVQFQFFALGALLALGLKRRNHSLGRLSRVALVGTGLLCWTLAAGVCHIKSNAPPPSASSLVFGYMLVAVGCASLLFGVLGVSRRFSPRLLYLGKISYGLYVFHMLAIHGAWKAIASAGTLSQSSISMKIVRLLSAQAVALSATMLLAILSYRFLESPFLKLKERFTVVRSRAV